MNIDDLTIGEAKLFGNESPSVKTSTLDNFANGQNVVVRTLSAGVWCGTLTCACLTSGRCVTNPLPPPWRPWRDPSRGGV